jgi:hypothetical protein
MYFVGVLIVNVNPIRLNIRNEKHNLDFIIQYEGMH